MSRRIDRDEIAEKGVLDNLLEPLKELLKVSDRVDSKLKDTAKTIKNSFNFTETSKGLRDLEKDLKRTNKIAEEKKNNQQEQTKIQRKLANAQERLNELSTEEAKELVKTREAIRKKNNALKASGNAYKELSNQSRDLKNESKRLGAELIKLENNGEKNTKEFRRLEKQYQETTAQARKTDAQLKDLDETVGDNFRKVGDYERATDKLTGSLKNLAGAIGIGAVVNGFKNFSIEASRAENMARTFFDTNEEGIQEIAKEANILSKVYGKEVNEVLRASNALSKQFGITGQESLSLLNEGFEKGGDVSGELLDNINEYSTNLKIAGLNAEESISIIAQSQREGVFSDKGVDAIHEATLSLREMPKVTAEALETIDMSAEQVQKSISDGSKTYFDVIQEISGRLKELGADAPQTGVVMADIFRGAGEEAGDFLLKLGDLNTSLDDLENQNQGLDGAVKNLTRSWNEFLYGIEEGTGAMDAFAGVINFVANNLTTIIGTLTRVGALFLIYQSRAKVAAAANFLFNGGLKNMISAIPRAISGLRSMSFSLRGVGTAMKSIPFVAIIAGLIELISYLWDATDATDANTEAERKLNDELERGNELREQRVNSQREIDELVAKRQELSQAQLKSLRDQIQEEIRLAEEADKNLKLSKERIEDAEYAEWLGQQKIERLKEEIRLVDTSTDAGRFEAQALRDNLEILEAESTRRRERIRLAKEGIEIGDDENTNIEKRREQLSLILPLIKAQTVRTKNSTDAKKKEKEAQDRLNKSLEASLRIRELISEIEGVEFTGAIDEASRRTQQAIDDELTALDEGNVSIVLNYQERINALNDIIDKETELRKINAQNAFEFEKTTLEAERERLESKKNLSQEDINRIKEINLEIELLEKEHQQEVNQIVREGEERKVNTKKKIDDKLIAMQKEQKAKEKKEEKERLEAQKKANEELLKTADEIQQALTEVYTDAVDRRIAKLEEEQNAAQKQQDFLQELAAQGNIDAQQSILATQRQREELEREQRKLEKRKAQIQLISSGLTTYANAIEQGQSPAQALTSTIANTQLLVNGLKSIQAFKEGSEDVGNGGKMDKDGGFLAMLHPKERVMTAEQNAKVSGISNPLLAEIGYKFKTGELTEQGGVYGYDISAVVSRLDSLEKTIKNKPENYVDFESIAGKIYLNHKQKKGRTVIHNKYKVKD